MSNQTRRVTQGDANRFKFRVYRMPGVPMDLTGATIVTRVPSEEDPGYVELPNDDVTLGDQSDADEIGVFFHDFDEAQSTLFKHTPPDAAPIEVLSLITQSGKPVASHAKASLFVDRAIPVG